eukprot:634183-Amphidinium_carterae.1
MRHSVDDYGALFLAGYRHDTSYRKASWNAKGWPAVVLHWSLLPSAALLRLAPLTLWTPAATFSNPHHLLTGPHTSLRLQCCELPSWCSSIHTMPTVQCTPSSAGLRPSQAFTRPLSHTWVGKESLIPKGTNSMSRELPEILVVRMRSAHFPLFHFS